MVFASDSYRNPRPVFVDFGLSRAFNFEKNDRLCGTPGYIPPETWQSGNWYPRGDIYSLGVAFFQLLAGTMVESAIGKTMRIPMEKFPKGSAELADFVGHMTFPIRQHRPRAREALQHAWMISSSNGIIGAEAATILNTEVTTFRNLRSACIVPQLAPRKSSLASTTTSHVAAGFVDFKDQAHSYCPPMQRPVSYIARPEPLVPWSVAMVV